MWRILFVDDDENILSGIRRSLHPLRQKWDMSFETDPTKVMALIEANPPHVVISDMRMPGKSGASLLREIMESRPEIIRIILSGYSDIDVSLSAVKPTHLFLNKPCRPDRLTEILSRLEFLLAMPIEPALRMRLGRITSLPVMPDIFQQLQEQLRNPSSDMEDIAKLISRDVALTAKCLQLINSAFFGLPRRIVNVNEAVKLLGIETLKALVLQVGVFSQFEDARVPRRLVDMVTHHSQRVGVLAQNIARHLTGDRREGDIAFSAGLLHDVGQLVLLASYPGEAASTLGPSRHPCDGPDCKRQQEKLGIHHCLVGAFLLALWGLPEAVVNAVMHHHDPAQGTPTPTLIAVHAADGLLRCRDLGIPWERGDCTNLNLPWLAGRDAARHLPAWNQMASH